MKTKFFLLLVIFLGISALTFAQSEATVTEKKDANTQVVAPDHAKTGECAGHATMGAKADCKWVDANNDGVCDTCKKTEKECKEACKSGTAGPAAKTGCASTCPHAKDCGKSTGSSPSKDGKK